MVGDFCKKRTWDAGGVAVGSWADNDIESTKVFIEIVFLNIRKS